MNRLVLYSGGQERRNALLHEQVVELSRRRDRLRLTYVPFCSNNAATFFSRIKRRYRAYGVDEFDCLPPDGAALLTQAGRRDATRRLKRSDIVYLAGGNTYYFLHHLRRAGLMGPLRRFAAGGGVLVGLSAGAILMTPNIGLAGYPPFDRDENDVGVRNQSALGLVGFEFFPHFTRSPRLRTALIAYSRGAAQPIYACRDGSGIVVEGDRFTAHGEVHLFDRGRTLRIGP